MSTPPVRRAQVKLSARSARTRAGELARRPGAHGGVRLARRRRHRERPVRHRSVRWKGPARGNLASIEGDACDHSSFRIPAEMHAATRLQVCTRVVTAVRITLPRASQRTASLYPGIAGPTLLVNLPALLGAIVKLFTPLFPKQARHPRCIAEVDRSRQELRRRARRRARRGE